MTAEERASNVVSYLIGTSIPDHILENLRQRITNEIKWTFEEDRAVTKETEKNRCEKIANAFTGDYKGSTDDTRAIATHIACLIAGGE